MKKFVSLLLALMLVLALGSMAFAADPTGTITITNATKDKTYDLYKILAMTTYDAADVDSNGDYVSMAYTFADEWRAFFLDESADPVAIKATDYLKTVAEYNTAVAAGSATGYYQIVDGDNTYYLYLTDDNIGAFAQDALAYCSEMTPSATDVAAANGNLVFSDLPLGYYLVYPQGATDITNDWSSICSLNTTDPNVELEVKAAYPEIEKSGGGTADLGGGVSFTITGTVPDITGYDDYDYIIYDSMESGITFAGITSVTIGTTTVKSSEEDPKAGYILKTSDFGTVTDLNGTFEPSFSLQIPVEEYQDQIGDTITVTYGATVGLESGSATNYAFLEYSNNPGTTEHGKSTTHDASADATSVTVNKYGNGDENNKLAGAKFVLYKEDGSGNKEYYYNNGSVTWVKLAADATVEGAAEAGTITAMTTDATGTTSFVGLASDGDYILQEIEAPKGYNRLNDPIDCDSDTMNVNNNSGTELPSTGGIGTTIFYIVGGLLVVGAAVLIVTKKRAGAAED